MPKIQLLTNLNPLSAPLHIPVFLTALLPLIVSVVLLRRYRLPLEASDKLVLLMCLVYLPLWITTGLDGRGADLCPFPLPGVAHHRQGVGRLPARTRTTALHLSPPSRLRS